jgi:hypothetical protein
MHLQNTLFFDFSCPFLGVILLLEASIKNESLAFAKCIYLIKFVYSEKATKFCKISTLLLSTVHTDKSKVEILQNFVAFSEYTNFMRIYPNSSNLNIINRPWGRKCVI